jgi:diguanylate cyclase (GGDEF)-like protein
MVLVGAMLVQRTTNDLLVSDALIDAEAWSSNLSHNISDLPSILKGKQPALPSIKILSSVRGAGRVQSFAFYDMTGRQRLSSDNLVQDQVANPTAYDRESNPLAVSVSSKPLVKLYSNRIDGKSSYYADVYTPLVRNGEQIGVMLLTLSQTGRRQLYFSSALQTALTIGFLLALGPAVGLWYTVKQNRAMEQKIKFASRHDPITSLLNRTSWLQSFPEARSRTTTEYPILATLVIEVSGIRVANEALGNTAGDHLLKVTAERLAAAAGPANFVGRIGSSQFGVLASPHEDPIEVAKFAQSIITALSQPVRFGDASLPVDVSVGIALSPSDGNEQVSLAKAAEIASATAHASARNSYRFFDAAVEKTATRQRKLERFAGDALSLNALDVHFQPIISLADGKLSGFEALLRVNHPELGPVSPADFVAAAESSGNIDKIGAWCLEFACRTAKQWPQVLTVSVNLSPLQFNSGRLIADLRRILEKTQFPAYRLELEITEGVMMGDEEFIYTQLRALQEMGVRVALDDFGTGYSSLSYLWKYPFSRIKIDESFVRDLEHSPTAQGIVSTIVSLGRSIGVPLTAEGIETAGQLAFLRQVKCDSGQGYFIGRPAPVTELASIILKDFSAFLPIKRKKQQVRLVQTSGSAV